MPAGRSGTPTVTQEEPPADPESESDMDARPGSPAPEPQGAADVTPDPTVASPSKTAPVAPANGTTAHAPRSASAGETAEETEGSAAKARSDAPSTDATGAEPNATSTEKGGQAGAEPNATGAEKAGQAGVEPAATSDESPTAAHTDVDSTEPSSGPEPRDTERPETAGAETGGPDPDETEAISDTALGNRDGLGDIGRADTTEVEFPELRATQRAADAETADLAATGAAEPEAGTTPESDAPTTGDAARESDTTTTGDAAPESDTTTTGDVARESDPTLEIDPARDSDPADKSDPADESDRARERDTATGNAELGDTITEANRRELTDTTLTDATAPTGTTASIAAVAEADDAKGAQPLGPLSEAAGALTTALQSLRAAITSATYPLAVPSAEAARTVGGSLVGQLDDYLIPRLARLDAPLLVVVGGSTGAGKSTLVNSFVRAAVSPAGVLRPTTRTPVLVCNPIDAQWFRRGELLPGLTRTAEATNDPHSLQIVVAPALMPGLAFLDAPDIDSVVDQNRALAAQLLAAADLWLFVTTAARYADAVPWDLLETAQFRGTVIALVLDRVPPEAAVEVTAHLAEMLAAHHLANAPLFVLPETEIDRQGLLPEPVTEPLRDWFDRLATDVAARATVVRQTLDGALAALVPVVGELAGAADEQVEAATVLQDRVGAAYRTARRTVENGVQDGRLLRGEVLARWQEFVGTGELMRTLEARVGRVRDRVVAVLTGRPAPGRQLQSAIEANLVTLIRGAAADAADQAYTGWLAHPAGSALLDPSLGRPSPDLPERAERLVRDWQRAVLELIRTEASGKRAVARGAAYAVNATGLLVMIGVFASTAFIPTGAEVAVAGGTTVAAQKVLEAIFGDQAIRTLATKAREDLLARVDALLDAEAARYGDRIAGAGIGTDPGQALRDAASRVERARAEAALTEGAPLALPEIKS
ncbi:hypothetical protein Pa4123_03260 [Phytohabitans aurantiacus]|uniref:Dynamin family protein n=1 Tax=Phytohabitans aurantiacus TaxID=3016789 RepID=A0ABQ5QMR5_9ACTN|nr:hypothetical protein Pa4123_03260 [Phytohabitans aurantiacus]